MRYTNVEKLKDGVGRRRVSCELEECIGQNFKH